jgi:hypothetical protein
MREARPYPVTISVWDKDMPILNELCSYQLVLPQERGLEERIHLCLKWGLWVLRCEWMEHSHPHYDSFLGDNGLRTVAPGKDGSPLLSSHPRTSECRDAFLDMCKGYISESMRSIDWYEEGAGKYDIFEKMQPDAAMTYLRIHIAEDTYNFMNKLRERLCGNIQMHKIAYLAMKKLLQDATGDNRAYRMRSGNIIGRGIDLI